MVEEVVEDEDVAIVDFFVKCRRESRLRYDVNKVKERKFVSGIVLKLRIVLRLIKIRRCCILEGWKGFFWKFSIW